jgi:hypothetical protein
MPRPTRRLKVCAFLLATRNLSKGRLTPQKVGSHHFYVHGFGQKSVNLTLDKLPDLELCGLDCLTGRPLGAIVIPSQNLHTIGVPLGGRRRPCPT